MLPNNSNASNCTQAKGFYFSKNTFLPKEESL